MATDTPSIQPVSTQALDIYTQDTIQSRIYTIRGVQVMLDRDLAQLYEVETKVLNQAVKRNIQRFPERFMFQLTAEEWENWKSQFVTTNYMTPSEIQSIKMGVRRPPFAFTEQGVSQLSSVLNSDIAIEMSIRIIDAFVLMRRYLTTNAGVLQRLDAVERHQLQTDQKIDRVLDCLEEGTLKEKAHIFSAGQIYEAKAFITDLISKARTRIILIDGYVSSPTIDLLDARQDNVPATIYTSGVGNSLKTLRDQYNQQYPSKPLAIERWRTEQHDRWLIIDNALWHGACAELVEVEPPSAMPASAPSA